MNVDEACTLVKEILYQFSVPVQLEIDMDKNIEISVPAHGAQLSTLEEIKALCEKRGGLYRAGAARMIFSWPK